jgi:hypothetical protein
MARDKATGLAIGVARRYGPWLAGVAAGVGVGVWWLL